MYSKEMKYVIIGECFPILFTQGQQHCDFTHLKPTSAGFCKFSYKDDISKVECYGESISLNLKPGQYDEKIIESSFNL